MSFMNNLENFEEKENDETSHSDNKKNSSYINILESMKFSKSENFFKRIIAYKKFFNQFSSKTFTLKDSESLNKKFSQNNKEESSPKKIITEIPSIDRKYSIEIKSLICEVFTYILGSREDALLDNFFNYFVKEFTQNEGSIKDFKRIFPSLLVKVRENVEDAQNKENEMFNLDKILGRPFIETLLVSFFLAQNSELEEKIMSLICKSTTQTKRFYSNLQKLQLLSTNNEKKTYIKINKYIDRLKMSNFTTQVDLY